MAKKYQKYRNMIRKNHGTYEEPDEPLTEEEKERLKEKFEKMKTAREELSKYELGSPEYLEKAFVLHFEDNILDFIRDSDTELKDAFFHLYIMMQHNNEALDLLGKHLLSYQTVTEDWIKIQMSYPVNQYLKTNNLPLKKICKMAQTYSNAYFKKFYPITYDEALTGNIIDGISLGKKMTEIEKDEKAHQKFDDWSNEHGLFSAVPCFLNGIITFENAKIYWDTDLTGVNNGEYSYTVNIYTFHYYDNFIYPGIAGSIDYQMIPLQEDGSGYEIHVSPKVVDFYPPKLFKIISPKTMKWSMQDRKDWNRYVNFAIDYQNRYVHSKRETQDYIMTTVRIFTESMRHINYLLYNSRKPSTKKSDKPPTKQTEAKKSTKEPVERKVRIIDGVSFTSIERPKFNYDKRDIEYTTPCWPQVGHYRFYKKSGKKVWVAPQLKYRKALTEGKNKSEIAPQPQTIKTVTKFNIFEE